VGALKRLSISSIIRATVAGAEISRQFITFEDISMSKVKLEFFRNESFTLPFSEAVRVDDMLYLSGQIGLDSSGQLVSGGIAAETRQTLENIKAVLDKYGSSMERVVKCTVMLADIREWEEMNKVYLTYFPNELPARSALGASGLALMARVEIECIAVVNVGGR
jgi:reactive intermediate/imine deaminase